MTLFLPDEAATIALGQQLAQHCPPQQFTIHLEGELGAGKTTLTRGLLRKLGHTGNVKSPTYTLVEHYELEGKRVFHFDLYRLSDPEELDYLGLDDYYSDTSLCILEWASQGGDMLPQPDLIITLSYQNNSRTAELTPLSPQAKTLCKNLGKA